MRWRFAIAAASLALGTTAAAARCPADAIPLRPGMDVPRAVARAGEGAAFCFAAGLYRTGGIVPKARQGFYGEPGAVLSGARRVAGFRREGERWVAGGQTQQGPRYQSGECLPDRPRCAYPEVVTLDGVPLRAIARRDALVPGTFFFDYEGDRIVLADDPTGRRVEASVEPFAIASRARGVVVDGLAVETYSTPIQWGAIGANLAPPEWTVRGVDVRHNHAVGVVVGPRSRIVRSVIHDNGEMGIGCVGDDILIADNEIAGNGFFSGLDPGWEGGGGKCALTRRLVVRGNYTHHNNAYGFWTDIDNIDTLYERNRVEFNANGGLSHEISYRATIRDNTFVGNGAQFDVWLWGAAILIQNSRDVTVHDNAIDMTKGGNGITLIQQARGSGRYGRHDTRDNVVRDNLVVSRSRQGSIGAVADHDPAGMKAGNNRFDRNTYALAHRNDDRFAWVDGFYTFEAYRRVSGQDRHSRLVPP